MRRGAGKTSRWGRSRINPSVSLRYRSKWRRHTANHLGNSHIWHRMWRGRRRGGLRCLMAAYSRHRCGRRSLLDHSVRGWSVLRHHGNGTLRRMVKRHRCLLGHLGRSRKLWHRTDVHLGHIVPKIGHTVSRHCRATHRRWLRWTGRPHRIHSYAWKALVQRRHSVHRLHWTTRETSRNAITSSRSHRHGHHPRSIWFPHQIVVQINSIHQVTAQLRQLCMLSIYPFQLRIDHWTHLVDQLL